MSTSPRFTPLGDQAVLAYLPDEAAAVAFASAVRAADPSWLQDVVPAYGSVGVFFDADQIRLSDVIRWLESKSRVRIESSGESSITNHQSPDS